MPPARRPGGAPAPRPGSGTRSPRRPSGSSAPTGRSRGRARTPLAVSRPTTTSADTMTCGVDEDAGAERGAVRLDRRQDGARRRVVVRAVGQPSAPAARALAPPVEPWIQSSTGAPVAGGASTTAPSLDQVPANSAGSGRARPRTGRRPRGPGRAAPPAARTGSAGAIRKSNGAGTRSPSTTSSRRGASDAASAHRGAGAPERPSPRSIRGPCSAASVPKASAICSPRTLPTRARRCGPGWSRSRRPPQRSRSSAHCRRPRG